MSLIDLAAWSRPVNWVATTAGIVAMFLLYGIPVAFLIELVVGVPAYVLLRSADHIGAAPIITIGAVAGSIGFPVVTALSVGSGDWIVAAALGGAAGALAGAVFWWTGLRPPRQVSFRA